MNSFSAGCANCSSHRGGFTPVSQRSNAINFASCHPCVVKCTSLANSSKQNRKNKCGYQCLQKCQNLEENVSARHSTRSAAPAAARHKTKISPATNICIHTSQTGCARFPANKTISPLDNAKYPSATHSNALQAAQAAAPSRVIHSPAPCFSTSK